MTAAYISTAQQRLLVAATACVALGTAVLLRTGTAINTRLFMNQGGALGETIMRLPHGLLPLVLLPAFALQLPQRVLHHRDEVAHGARDHAEVP